MKKTLLATFFMFSTALVYGQAYSGSMYSGLQFLSIGPNASSLGISEAHTAVNLGSASLYSNPSMLIHNDRNQLTASYSNWIADTHNSHASVLFRRENDVLAAGVYTSVVGDIEARNSPGEPSGVFNVRYLSFAGAYSRSLGPVHTGITAMYVHEQLYQQNASGYAFNFGLSMNFMDDRITVGSALLNLGQMDELAELASELPTAFKFGVHADVIQFSVSESSEIPLLISMSGDFISAKQHNSTTSENEANNYFAMGLAVEVSELITIRAGHKTGNTTRPWSFGAGLKIDLFDFNYAFVPFETGFGITHTVSLGYFF